jgi:hypothetical protein
MRGAAIISVLLGISTTGLAEDTTKPAVPRACQAPEHRQFDFWVGEWSVTQAGKAAGNNRIERILDGCALLESWTGASGYRGNSLNFYDPATKRWHQTWIGTDGQGLALDGEFVAGKMILAGTRLDPETRKPVHDRITWTPNSDGTLRQVWETSGDGNAWSVIFDGLYSRLR